MPSAVEDSTARSQAAPPAPPAPVEPTIGTKLGAMASATGTLMAALAALGALYFSYEALSASNDQLELARAATRTGQLESALQQLDSDKPNIRLGGVYLLDRLVEESVDDRPAIRRLLEEFVRAETSGPCDSVRREAPVDIQAALGIIARHSDLPEPTLPVNLRGACLAATIVSFDNRLDGADLSGIDATGAILMGAGLADAELVGATLTRAILDEADLRRAHLDNANLVRADLTDAELTDAELGGADLTDADLVGARLADAELDGANLTGADLSGADLTDAYLIGVDFSRASLAGANLTGIVYDRTTRWPSGFTPPPSA